MLVGIETEKIERTDRLVKYVHNKVSGLEKHIPRTVRESVKVEVRLRRTGSKGTGASVCEIKINLPRHILIAKEATPHIFAAVDVAVANIRHQLNEYKTQENPTSLRERLRRTFGSGEYPH
jgi:ribosomal subunit interface protein